MSFDTIEENRRFAEKFSFPFPLLCDTNRSIGISYGACSAKDAKHASRVGYIIDSAGHIQKGFSQVDAKSFPETVLEEL